MAKVGRFVTDPKAGAYCQIVLDSGEKILVNHDKGGFKGGTVTVTQVKWMGLATGETFLRLDLDDPRGQGGARPALDRRGRGQRAGHAARRRRRASSRTARPSARSGPDAPRSRARPEA